MTWPLVFTLGVRRYALSGAPLGSQSPRVLSGVVGRQPGPRASNLVTSGRNFRRGVSARWLCAFSPSSPLDCALTTCTVFRGTIGTCPGFCRGISCCLRGPRPSFLQEGERERRASSEFSEYLGSGLKTEHLSRLEQLCRTGSESLNFQIAPFILKVDFASPIQIIYQLFVSAVPLNTSNVLTVHPVCTVLARSRGWHICKGRGGGAGLWIFYLSGKPRK